MPSARIAIGFWREGDHELSLMESSEAQGNLPKGTVAFLKCLPRPHDLVMEGWEKDRLLSILTYLRSGHKLNAQLGYSYCRFRCGIPRRAMGDAELTDGLYVWPEGLVHYVEVHAVRLPPFFVDHMAENGFRVPPGYGRLKFGSSGWDQGMWVNWCNSLRGERRPG